MTDWINPPTGEHIADDINEMIEALQRSKVHGPYEMHLPDEFIIAHGGNPEDYEVVAPGFRRIVVK
jgi:hypothetical protein